MYNNIFDSHAHYTDKAFNDDRENMLDSLRESGICGVINCGADLESSKESLKLAEKYDYFYFACGIHPEEVENLPENYIDILRDMAKHKKCVAIGEIGLDYYWDEADVNKQKEHFVRQIDIARQVKKPILIHSRDAAADTMSIMKAENCQDIGGIIHCYSYSKELAKEFLKKNRKKQTK